MKLFLAALTIFTLPLFGVSCGSASVQTPTTTQTAEAITLTQQNPTGSFPVQPGMMKNLPTGTEVPPELAAVVVDVTKVVNPNTRPVTIFVYLSRPNEKRDNPAEKIAVGNFSLYPVDRPGKFSLNPVPALRKAVAASNDANLKEWKIVFELEQKPEETSSPLAVTIATPIWALTKG